MTYYSKYCPFHGKELFWKETDRYTAYNRDTGVKEIHVIEKLVCPGFSKFFRFFDDHWYNFGWRTKKID